MVFYTTDNDKKRSDLSFFLTFTFWMFVAGETSSGKSTIINLIVGENIVPIKIQASTRKVCRIKYSEKLQVSTLNAEGIIIKDMFFENTQEMKTFLLTTIESTDKSVQIVDIWYPVKLLKVSSVTSESRVC